jgi:flagellar motor protein MotB
MAMFIALFAMSTVDVTKFKAFAIGFNEALDGGKLDAGIGGSGKATSPVVGQGNGDGPFTGGQLAPKNGAVNGDQIQQILTAMASNQSQAATQRRTLADVDKRITDAAKHLGFGGKVHTKELNNGLQVTLLADGARWTLPVEPVSVVVPGRCGRRLLRVDRPRSESTVSRGRGDQDFVASNATPEGRAQNRRVEIIVQSKLVQQALDQAGLNDEPVTPSTKPIAPITPIDSSSGAKPNLKPVLGGN